MRLGVCILPDARWAEARERWVAAEAMGFAHAWTYDHLTWRSLRDDPWFAMVPTLAAAAGVTERIRLGPLVASANFRHPVPFAKELVALDDLSQGRLTVGLGAGGTGWDATALGQEPWSPAERAERFEELVVLLDLLLREPAVSWEGRHHVAVEARSAPGCVQRPRPPFAIAATGPRGLRLAARHAATWVSVGPRGGEVLTPEAGAALVREQVARLDEACVAEGRDPASIDRLVLAGLLLRVDLSSPDALVEAVGRYAEAGATDLVLHWPRPTEPYRADRAAFEAAVLPLLADGTAAGHRGASR